ncbi:MAG: hypothetical protein N2170_09080 [Bacteroidia bacterium]|nr:hypothetical protein [Bacteroidia bacterium]
MSAVWYDAVEMLPPFTTAGISKSHLTAENLSETKSPRFTEKRFPKYL